MVHLLQQGLTYQGLTSWEDAQLIPPANPCGWPGAQVFCKQLSKSCHCCWAFHASAVFPLLGKNGSKSTSMMHKYAKYCYSMLKLQKLAENESKQHFERCPMVCSQAIPNSVAAAETFQELMLQTWLVIKPSSFTKHWCNLSNGHTNWRRLNASASISSSCKECNLTSKSKKIESSACTSVDSTMFSFCCSGLGWSQGDLGELGSLEAWSVTLSGLWPLDFPGGETGQLGGSRFTLWPWVPLASQASPRWFQSTPGWSLKNIFPARLPGTRRQASSLQLLILWFRVHKSQPSHWYLWISRYTCDVRIAKHVVQVASWPARTSWRMWR